MRTKEVKLSSIVDSKVCDQLETVIDNYAGGVMLFAVETPFKLRPLYIGPGCCKYLKDTAIDFEDDSSDFFQYVYENDRKDFKNLVQRTLENGKLYDLAFHVYTKDNDFALRYGRLIKIDFQAVSEPVILVAVTDLMQFPKRDLFMDSRELIHEINNTLAFFKFRVDDDLTLLSCNSRFCNFLGYDSEEDLFAHNFSSAIKIITKKSYAKIKQLFDNAVRNKIDHLTAEVEVLSQKGEIKRMLVWGSFTQEENSKVIIACAVDHTAQSRFEEVLYSIIDSVNGGFIVWKIDEDNVMSPSMVSRGYCEYLGYDEKTLIKTYQKMPLAHVYFEDLPDVTKTLLKLFSASDSTATLIHRLVKADGSSIWVNASISLKTVGGSRNLYTSFVDITDLKNSERELRMRETAYYITVAQSGKSVAQYDVIKNELRQRESFDLPFYAQKVVKNLPQSAIDSGVVAPISVADYLKFYSKSAMQTPSTASKFLMKNLLTNKFEWFSVDRTLIYDDDKKPTYAIIVCTNVDKEYREELARKEIDSQDKQEKIMLIADNAEPYRALLRGIFANEFKIIEAKDGSEALSVLSEYGVKISVMLLDIDMPNKDGIAVLNEIQNHTEWSNMATVAISNQNESEYGTDAIKLGAVEFLSKSAKKEIVKLRVSSALEKRAAEQLRYKNAILQASKLEESRHFKELQHMAETDSVTGLYNRAAFNSAVQEMLQNAKPNEYILSVIDMDNFKVLNDLYGHEEGDKVLRHMAKKIKLMTDQMQGVCCRADSDNFVYVMKCGEETSGSNDSLMTDFFTYYKLPFRFVVRAGRFIINDLSISIDAMIDRAMLAKKSIKGVYNKIEAYYTDEMRDKLIMEQALVADAESAIANDEFVVYFQPKFSISSGKIVGAEALVRWNHPTYGFLTPSAFIPLFERNGLIVKLDEYVWNRTAKTIRKWYDTNREILPISVNVSRMNIYSPNFVDTLIKIAKKYDFPPRLLELEITESAFIQNPKQFTDVIIQLRKYGFVIEMDDFGSGYSSLSALRDINVDTVKLDIRFMPPDNNDTKGKSILSTVVNLAKLLNLNLVAEGVENEQQVKYLHSIGCDIVQGFFFAKPMPLSDFEAAVDRTNGKK